MSGRLAALFAVGRPKADEAFRAMCELESRGGSLALYPDGRTLRVHLPRGSVDVALQARLRLLKPELVARLRAGVVHLTPSRRARLYEARLPPEPLPF